MSEFKERVNKAFGSRPIDKLSKMVSDDQLKKMSSQDRQDLICDVLATMREVDGSNKLVAKMKDAATVVLKAYLLECGEGIDVEFSQKKVVIHWRDNEDEGTAEFDDAKSAQTWIRNRESQERYNPTGFEVVD